MRNNIRCACGLPLHYSDSAKQAEIIKEVQELGEFVTFHHGDNSYKIQRHYFHLHGVTPDKIDYLIQSGILFYV